MQEAFDQLLKQQWLNMQEYMEFQSRTFLSTEGIATTKTMDEANLSQCMGGPCPGILPSSPQPFVAEACA